MGNNLKATTNNREEKSNPSTALCPAVGDESLTQILKPIQQKFNVPAIAAAVVTSAGIKFVGAVGVRKRGTEIPVELNDLWHIGSNGKAMTSVVIALLVERLQLKWNSTVAEIFPEIATQMNPQFQKVTVMELLSHRSGLPANVPLSDYLGADGPALRLRAVREELAKQPLNAPGTNYLYSNVGYIIAGAIIEKITKQSFETAISNEVFKPLQMTSAGLGGTGTHGKIDQPWPHTADGEPTSQNGAAMDNPPLMDSAGRIHCSIYDWAKFVSDQLRGALLKPESYQKIQTPPFGGDYAMGWNVFQRDWAGGKALNHRGDNTMNCANVWIAQKKDFALLICVNQSGDTAFKATDAAATAMIDLIQRKNQSK